jgi:hypothetical protein
MSSREYLTLVKGGYDMEINVTEQVIETVCNSLRASRHSLQMQLCKEASEIKIAILRHQLAEVEEALKIFEQV